MEDGGGDGGSIWYSNAKKAKIMVEFVSFIYNSACICFGFGQKIILWSEDLCKKQYNYENVKKLFESLLYHQAQSSKQQIPNKQIDIRWVATYTELTHSSLVHLMCAIASAHARTCATRLMCVKNSMRHFCLWHWLFGTLEQRKWKNKNITFYFNLC